MQPSPMFPSDFKKTLDDYLETIRLKKNEYDKRSYFKSKIMEGVFRINPDYIDFEKDKVDLYFAGVLIETKSEINRSNVDTGLREISRYLQKRPNTVRAVITDGIIFQLYNNLELFKNGEENTQIYNIKPEETFQVGITLENEDVYNYSFNKLYSMLYPLTKFKVLENDVIVPRITHLIDRLSVKLGKAESIRYKAWKSYISIVFGDPSEATEEVYKKQALLYYFVIFLTSKIMGINTTRSNILSGSAFISKGIWNFIDRDNFFDFLDENSPILDEIENELDLYDFAADNSVSEEVFRLLYEEIVSPSHRHELGEFYTPTWLAKILVDAAVKTGNEVMLDPACGSGTFIRLILRKIHELNGTGKVIGFDINPIAVQISRVNYLLEENNVSTIPVFLADSLMPNLVTLGPRQGNVDGLKEVVVDFESIIGEGGTEKFTYDVSWSLDTVSEYIDEMRNLVSNSNDIPEKFDLNSNLIKKIRKLNKEDKNHIWFYVLKNMYTPYYMQGKVDIVIGNPPWLSYHDVKNVGRQRFLETLYTQYEMGSGARNKANQDMAAFFVARSKEFLGQKDGKIFFVLTRSIMNGDQYNEVRLRKWNVRLEMEISNVMRIARIWDIEESANPFRKPACMMEFNILSTDSNIIQGAKISAAKANKQTIINGQPSLEIRDTTFYINDTGHYSGISEYQVEMQGVMNTYRKKFKRGASIFPRPYFFVDIITPDKFGTSVRTNEKYMSLKNKRTSKGDFESSFDGEFIPNDLIFETITADDIERFRLKSEHSVVLPIYRAGEKTQSILIQNNFSFELSKNFKDTIQGSLQEKKGKLALYEDYVKKFNEMEKDWERYRGSKFNPNGKGSAAMSLWDTLNFTNKLTSQFPWNNRYTVVYNKSGASVKSAVILTDRIVYEDTTQYYYASSKEEAYYICGLLNSSPVMAYIMKTGIKSERDIHKKIFEAPFPDFVPGTELHMKISAVSQEISAKKENNEDSETLMKELNNLCSQLIIHTKN